MWKCYEEEWGCNWYKDLPFWTATGAIETCQWWAKWWSTQKLIYEFVEHYCKKMHATEEDAIARASTIFENVPLSQSTQQWTIGNILKAFTAELKNISAIIKRGQTPGSSSSARSKRHPTAASRSTQVPNNSGNSFSRAFQWVDSQSEELLANYKACLSPKAWLQQELDAWEVQHWVKYNHHTQVGGMWHSPHGLYYQYPLQELPGIYGDIAHDQFC